MRIHDVTNLRPASDRGYRSSPRVLSGGAISRAARRPRAEARRRKAGERFDRGLVASAAAQRSAMSRCWCACMRSA